MRKGRARWASCSSARVAARGSRSIRGWPARRAAARSAARRWRSPGPRRSRRWPRCPRWPGRGGRRGRRRPRRGGRRLVDRRPGSRPGSARWAWRRSRSTGCRSARKPGHRRSTMPRTRSPMSWPNPVREQRGRVRVQDNVVLRVWRRQLGSVQKIFRKINQAAYLISVPFLMILLFGAVVENRPMALFGATVVVLLNIGRLVAGTRQPGRHPVPRRDRLEQDEEAARRVIEPAVTIGLVVLAFTFIPWLSSGQSAKGSIADRIRSGAQGLKKEMKGEVDQVVDVEKLGDQAPGEAQGARRQGQGPRRQEARRAGAGEAQGTWFVIERRPGQGRAVPAASARPSRPSRSARRRSWTRPRPQRAAATALNPYRTNPTRSTRPTFETASCLRPRPTICCPPPK